MSSNPSTSVPAVVSEPAPVSAHSPNKITQADLEKHAEIKDMWLLISGKVYDTTAFLDEHPGGDEVIICEAGKDATEAFEDVGHSEEARKLLEPMFVGDFDGVISKKVQKKAVPGHKDSSPSQSGSYLFVFPLAIVVAYLAWRFTLAN
ncbi:putative cytochrome b5 [Mrakia frigida]|uniref:cytochrome b5-like heme/steroid binding domain-containing protein n=1 Tax=Mrakia frigida TaxID=29902 RepID=UPI003FCBFCE9